MGAMKYAFKKHKFTLLAYRTLGRKVEVVYSFRDRGLAGRSKKMILQRFKYKHGKGNSRI